MTTASGGFVAVAITREEARVWTSGVASGAKPDAIHAPSEMLRHHHVREAQHHHGHDTDRTSSLYYESIAAAIEGASHIVLIGHGKGKANEVLRFTQYLERKNPALAHKVVGAIDSDLEALSQDQVLALVRDWFDQYQEFI